MMLVRNNRRGWFGLLLCVLMMGVAAAAPETAPSNAEGKAQAAAPQGEYEILQDRADRVIARLPNRMIVVVQELHSAPVVSAQVWIKTGSIYEQEHVGAGLSHFLEHLLSGGATTKRTEEESKALLSHIGAEINASTGLESVRYYINTTGQFASEAVDLLSDWMQNSLITPKEFDREREVIQNEFAMGQGEPGRIFWKLTQQTRFREHPARHPTIGYLDEYLNITREEIVAFYKRMYVPNNMLFVVAGDVDRMAVLKQIAGLWSSRPTGKLPELSFPIEPAPTKPRSAEGMADMRQPMLRLAWPGTRQGARGDEALDLLSVILGDGETSRLVHGVRDKGLASTVSAYNISWAWGEGFFGIDATIAPPRPPATGPASGGAGKPMTQPGSMVQPGAVAKAGSAPVPASKPAVTAPATAPSLSPEYQQAIEMTKLAILEEVHRIRRDGVSAEELARAKRQILAEVVNEAQTAMSMADRVATDTLGMGDPDRLQRYAKRIREVTADEVGAAAARFLDDSRQLTLTLLPAPPGSKAPPLTRPADEKPAKPSPRETVELDNIVLIEKIRASLEGPSADIRPMQIGPVKLVTLPNGLKVLLQRSTVVPSVSMQFYQLGGLLADEPGREGVGNAVQAMLLKGAGNRTAEQIAQEIESLGAHVDFVCGNNSSYGQATCLAEDWDRILTLMSEVILTPKFPAEEWEKLRPRLLAGIARQTDSWGGELRERFRAAYFPGHVWSTSPLGRAEVVGALTVEDMRSFYQAHLGASNAVLVIFGDINPEAVEKRAAKLFEAMPEKALATVTPVSPTPQKNSRVQQFKTNKSLAAVQIGLGPGVTRQHPDYPAIRVLEEVLGQFPSGWLSEALRGRGPGLVYAIGAGSTTGVVPGCFNITFNTQPHQVVEAITRSMEVVARIKGDPIDQVTLDNAKASVLREEFAGQQTNAGRAMQAALAEIYGLGQGESARFLKSVNELTPEVLQAVARLYLANPVVVVISHQPAKQEELDAALKAAGAAPAAKAPEDGAGKRTSR